MKRQQKSDSFSRMSPLLKGLALFSLLGGIFLYAGEARASCGLDHCPIELPDKEYKLDLRLQSKVQHTRFDLAGLEGHFTEFFLSAEYRGFESWTLGGNIPLIFLKVEEDEHTGFGNGVVYGEWSHALSEHSSIAFGNQVELPWGSGEGMSDDHWVILPYLSLHASLGPGFLMFTGGFSQSIGGHSHDSDQGGASHFVFVNPHESREVLGRIAVGLPLMNNRLRVMTLLNIQEPMSGSNQETLLQAGARALYRFSDTLSVQAVFESPITEAKRFENRSMLGCILAL